MCSTHSDSSKRQRLTRLLGFVLMFSFAFEQAKAVTLADQPVFANSDVPGNLALALSVEFPTAISVANLGDYADTTEYLGYFDPRKCYAYQLNTAIPASSYFQPTGLATGTNKHSCTGLWSGNFMNWATMQTIDPFRWALTGGYRSVDTATDTILEKAWGAKQGNVDNFPLRGTDQTAGGGNHIPSSLVRTTTPFSWTGFKTSIWSRGNVMAFSGTGDPTKAASNLPTDLTNATSGSVYQVYVRVKVCDGTTASGALLESNCVKYGTNYKPEGLMQQYANKIRYAAFAYLNAGGNLQQGGVMRAPMGFIGPTYPQPLSSAVITNTRAEWDATTGIMGTNPDTTSATASGVTQSGAMNFLNKFGQAAQNYMTYDNVSELYYAVIRYFQNLGNVPEWTNSVAAGASGRDTRLDGFPALDEWTGKDPILYSCQKNFVLGIGDNHTHYDYNVGGTSVGATDSTRPLPALVSSDTFNKADTWTKKLQAMEGIAQTPWWKVGGINSTYYIAGLAYGAHVNDIRSDLPGTQTVTTYWMDVMEYQRAEDRNPFYLAAKYGGFSVPTNYDPTSTLPLTQSWWNTTGSSINMKGSSRLQPDNYFLAGNAGQMVTGLKKAFTNIANAIQAFTTSFSLSTAQVSSSGSASFGSQYDSKNWTGVVTASKITFAADGTPSASTQWSTSTTFEAQLAGTGWDTGRNIATWNGNKGVAFRSANLTSAQSVALTPSYATSNTATEYLNYLRGDRKNEVGSTASGSTKALRARTLLLGDIVNAKVTPVGAPDQKFSDANNPGYSAFKTSWASRPTMVYAGANDGMLHAFNGALTGTTAGKEQFAYVPSALYQGPNGTPQTDGLAQLGNPNYTHHFYVDATPVAYDVDFNYAGGVFTTTSSGGSDWHTLLIGGLGKGGKSYYAIDVTDPVNMNSETAVAGKVIWEFTDPTMGFSYGTPTVVKTKKYGWVVVLTSGYNNSDNRGYIYFVSPKTGALLEKVQTGVTSRGLTQAAAYVNDFTDGTADSIYVGDLDGQLWRFDITAAKGSTGAYPAPTKLATLADAAGNAQPITTAPLIEIHPLTRKRFVLLGSGQLLDSSDVASQAVQTFYAFIDGTGASFSAVSSPITRSNLTPVADVTVGVDLTNTSKGWYLDIGSGTDTAWRIVSSPAAYNGVVTFSTLLTSGNACSPTGQSRVYAMNFGSGKSVLSPTGAAYVSFTTAVTDLKIVSVEGRPQIIAGTVGGEIKSPAANLKDALAIRLLNWRELRSSD